MSTVLEDFIRGGLPAVLDWPESASPIRNPFVERVPPTPDPEDEAASATIQPQPFYKNPLVWVVGGVGLVALVAVVAIAKS